MQRIIVFLAVVGMCVGCAGSQGSAPDYEVRSEHDENVSDLKVKSVEVYTGSIKEKELRRIAEEIKKENADQDAIDITFYGDKQGKDETQSGSQETGAAIVVNNQEAANQMLSWPLFTGADTKKVLNEQNGIVVISFAQMEQELKEEQRELDKELKEAEEDLEQDMKQSEQEMKEAEQKLEQEMKEMEEDMQQLPKP